MLSSGLSLIFILDLMIVFLVLCTNCVFCFPQTSGQPPIKRYSSLYGASLSCLELVPGPLLEVLLPVQSTSGLNGRLTGSGLDYFTLPSGGHHNINLVKHLTTGILQTNISFEWQTRPSQASPSSISYRSSASSSSSSSSSLLASSGGQFVTITESNSLRFTGKGRDGQLQIPPFEPEQYSPDIHDAYYRCLVRLNANAVLASHQIRLQVVVEKAPTNNNNNKNGDNPSANQATNDVTTVSVSASVRSVNSTETTIGGDALFKCEFAKGQTLLRVSGWVRDDGQIYLPLSNLVDSISLSYREPNHNPSQMPFNGAGFQQHFVNYSHALRHFVLPEGELLIANVEHRDLRHRYRCHVRHEITSQTFYSSTWAHIKLKEPSELYQSGPRLNGQVSSRHTIVVNDGEPAFFYCSFDGTPIPRVQWFYTDVASTAPLKSGPYFGQQWLSSSSPSSSSSGFSQTLQSSQQQAQNYIIGRNFFAIEKVIPEDTGLVTCQANNSNNIVKHEMMLFVKQSLQLSLLPSNAHPMPGDEVFMSCELRPNATSSAFQAFDQKLRDLISAHFLVNTIWLHNGRPIVFDHRKRKSSDEKISVRAWETPTDNGVYQCSIKLTAPDYDHEAYSAAARVTAMEKLPELTGVFTDQIKLSPKRDSLSLRCIAEGIPAPTFRWTLDGVELRPNSHVRIETGPLPRLGVSSTISYLNISSIRSQDVGVYECIASNYLGSVSHRSRISQSGPPYIKPIGNQTAVLGRSLTLNCTYGGYPIEDVIFYKINSDGSEKRLPFDERHSVPYMGSVTISPVELTDKGHYRCLVLGGNGKRAQENFNIIVAKPPVVSPLLFSDNIAEGARGSAICTVTSGDGPISITWLKDGQTLKSFVPSARQSAGVVPHGIVQIMPITEFMSSLILSNVSRAQQGTYTCLVTSPIASANTSAYLSVSAPPQWRLKPSDHYVTAGQPLVLNCQTSGQPQPVTRWKFVRLKAENFEPMPILSSQQIHVLENGSLFIRAVEPKNAGIYICDASNGLSAFPVEARSEVHVLSRPKVTVQSTVGATQIHAPKSQVNGAFTERIALRKGDQCQFLCSAMGSTSPMTAQWLRPSSSTEDKNLDDLSSPLASSSGSSSSRTSIREESKLNEKRSYLFLSHVARQDSGIYSCLASNLYGHSIAFIELLVQEPPDPPTGVTAQDVLSRAVTLAWSTPFDGNAPITSFTVEYWPVMDDDDERSIPTGQPGSGMQSTRNEVLTLKSIVALISITGLKPITTYRFRVAATNDLGTSRFSESLTITTELEAPSLIVDDLRTLVLSTRTIKLFWTAIFSHKSEHVDGFYIGYRPIHQSSTSLNDNDAQSKLPSYTFKTMHDIPAWQRFSFNSTSLSQSSASSSSSSSASSSSDASESSSLTSFCEKFASEPSQKSRSLVMIKNSAPPPSRAQIAKDNHFSSVRVRCSYEFTLDSLARKTRYGIIVQAFNLKGTGPSSSEAQVVTLAKDPPGKTRLRLLNTTAYEAALSWTLDKQDSELISAEQEQDYNILKDSVASSHEDETVDGYIISYRTIVKNSVLQESEHDEFYRKQKQLSTSPGMSSVSSPVSDNWETVSVSGRTNVYVLRSLRCGTHYRARVEAFNEMGSGESSELLEFSTLGKAPTAPQADFLFSNITSVSLDLSKWQNGHCPISHFSIRYRARGPGTDSSWILVSSHIKPEIDWPHFHIRQLQPGSWYELAIAAHNDAGYTETRHIFSTLSLTGATVEPLQMDILNKRHLGSFLGSSLASAENVLEDPMILIPASCALIVLVVVAGATVFIFFARSKDVLNSQEHYCQHRSDQSRSDQFSLNSFGQNYSKTDLMRSGHGFNTLGAANNNNNNNSIANSYETNSDPAHLKLTNLDGLTGCGGSSSQTTSTIVYPQSTQYVDLGPVSYMETKLGDDGLSCFESLAPSLDTVGRQCLLNHGSNANNAVPGNGNNGSKMLTKQESFYSTPVNVSQNVGHYSQTLRHQNHPNQSESLYGQHQTQQTQHGLGTYYTHTMMLGVNPNNGDSIVSAGQKRDGDHVYELPKQAQNMNNTLLMMGLGQQGHPTDLQNEVSREQFLCQQTPQKQAQTISSKK